MSAKLFFPCTFLYIIYTHLYNTHTESQKQIFLFEQRGGERKIFGIALGAYLWSIAIWQIVRLMDGRGKNFELRREIRAINEICSDLDAEKTGREKNQEDEKRPCSIRPCEDHPKHLTGTTFRHVVSCNRGTGCRVPERGEARARRGNHSRAVRRARRRCVCRFLFFCFGKIFTDKSPADEGKRRRITPVRNPDRGR